MLFRKANKTVTDHVNLSIDNISIPVFLKNNPRAKRYHLRFAPKKAHFILTVPKRGTRRKALDFAHQHRAWLKKIYNERKDKICFKDQAEVPFRGEPHRLIFLQETKRRITLERDGHPLPVIKVSGHQQNRSISLHNWLKKQARTVLEERVRYYVDKLGVEYKSIRISDPQSRWGSCSSTGTLSFSWRLILAPPDVLDYVAAHEVAHLVEMNHSKAFWDVVESIFPAYQEHRQWLRDQGSVLFAYGNP